MPDNSENSHIERTVYVSPDDVSPGGSIRYGCWIDDRGGYFPFPSYVPLTLIEAATGSDYSGNLVEASNARRLHEDFPWLVEVHGGHGTFGVAYLGRRENQNPKLLEAIDALAQYPIYDDSDHSDLEFERAAEAWGEAHGGRSDFNRALVDHFDENDDEFTHDLDSIPDHEIDDLWYDCTEKLCGGESHTNRSGSDIYFPIKSVMQKIDRNWPGVDEPHYHGERPTIREQLRALCERSRTSLPEA